jgi:hypothetical protein
VSAFVAFAALEDGFVFEIVGTNLDGMVCT